MADGKWFMGHGPYAISHQQLAMTANRTIWMVSGGAEAVPGIQRARAMGLHVVVSDMNPVAPGFKSADDAVVADTYDADGTVAAAVEYHAHKRPIDGVMCMAADVPLTVASVAARPG